MTILWRFWRSICAQIRGLRMIWILFVLLFLWIGAGILLLILGSRTLPGDYQRIVKDRIVKIGQTLSVTVKVRPPVGAQISHDQDIVLAIDHSSSMGSGPGSAF